MPPLSIQRFPLVHLLILFCFLFLPCSLHLSHIFLSLTPSSLLQFSLFLISCLPICFSRRHICLCINLFTTTFPHFPLSHPVFCLSVFYSITLSFTSPPRHNNTQVGCVNDVLVLGSASTAYSPQYLPYYYLFTGMFYISQNLQIISGICIFIFFSSLWQLCPAHRKEMC